MAFAALMGLILLLVVAAPVVLVVYLTRIAKRLGAVERELAELRRLEAERAASDSGWPGEVREISGLPSIAHWGPGPATPSSPPAEPPIPTPPVILSPLSATVPPPAPAPAPVFRRLDLAGIEQLVGGVWLQNLGAVLLLVGLFLMIVWGYTTGRLGPQVLVLAGVGLGLAFAWRGDRVARRMPRFGHGLVGTGIGIVYLTLYLGFVRLHVLGPVAAFPLLALVSVGSVLAGLRYRVQLIGALGVIGAFLPQFLAGWLGLGGFHLSPWMLLAYLAVVDLLVFALTARVGWSALDLTALVLSAIAWSAAFHAIQWGWAEQLGLTFLFTALGLAPLPRLITVAGRVRAIDLAVVAAAPLALLIASSPFLMWADREPVGMLLFALSALWFGAAWWVDVRRPERDLWISLTAAGTLYATAGLARLAELEYTSLAWCAEGALLLALGLRPRAGSLRVWGSLVMAAGGMWSLYHLADRPWEWGPPPIVHEGGLRVLGELVAVLVGAFVVARGRSRLTAAEQSTPELWSGFGNVLLLFWISVEAAAVASALVDPHRLPGPVGVSLAQRREALEWAIRYAGWTAQAGTLVWLGTRGSGPFLRWCGHAVGIVAMAAALLWLAFGSDGWGRDWSPVLNPTSLLGLGVAASAFAIAARLAARRAPLDRRAAEAWCAAATLALMLWTSRESGHVARTILDASLGGASSAADPRRLQALTAACTSGAWLLEAVALLIFGWWRGSAFLRWCGLTVIGVTLIKFVAVDLQSVDVFWRFLTAIVVGAALLAMSYVYQRRAQGREREAPTDS